MNVVIGIDPHKASHHAFAVDDRELELSQLSVRATRYQTQRLLAWAAVRVSDVCDRRSRRTRLPVIAAAGRRRRTRR